MSGPNEVHPTAVVGTDVELGTGNVIAAYAVILGPCRIGDRNWIGPHATIGTPAEVRPQEHPAGGVSIPKGSEGIIIGHHNVFREYTAVHLPAAGRTVVGDRCYVMSYSHVPHDAQFGDEVTVANAAQLGGHVAVGDGANIGLGATVHQRLRIGAGAMIGMGAVVTKPIPPFALAYGNPARIAGANVVGLRRHGYADADVMRMDDFFRRPSGHARGELAAALRDLLDDHDAAV